MRRLMTVLLVLVGSLSLLNEAGAEKENLADVTRERRLLGLLGGSDEGLLGGILGGGDTGLLSGLLGDGDKGLLGGLLGGENGLLGGILGENGLLGGLLGGVLKAVLCLLEKLGLTVVLDLLKGLKVDDLLGLNELACSEDGVDVLVKLLREKGWTSHVKEVACIAKALGVQPVITLIQFESLNNILSLNAMTCPAGQPLFLKGSTTSNLLLSLIDVLGLEGVLEIKADDLFKLDRRLINEGITDARSLIASLHCLIRKTKLKAIIDSIDVVGSNNLLKLKSVVCGNDTHFQVANNFTVDYSVLSVVLRDLGIDHAIENVVNFGLAYLLQISKFLISGGTLRGDQLKQVLCQAQSLGADVVVPLLHGLGLADVLALRRIFCPNDVPRRVIAKIDPSFVVHLLGTCKRKTAKECLDALGNALKKHGTAVCYFCSVISVESVREECDLECETKGFQEIIT